MNKLYLNNISDHIDNCVKLLHDPSSFLGIQIAASICAETIKYGGKILLFGNGGSAADAQHIAAEFMVRLIKDRDPYPALALTTDTSVLTAISNDFDFDFIFARQLNSLGNLGDVAIGFSTSGESENVLMALDAARRKNMKTIFFTGPINERNKNIFSDVRISVPGTNAGRIQESHILLGHILVEMTEKLLENCEQ